MRNAVFDWKNDPTGAVLAGMRINNQRSPLWTVCTVGDDHSRLENCVFRNFPWLDVASAEVVNCKFENCQRIQGREFQNCIFEHCSEVQSHGGHITDCTFDHLETLFINDTKMIGGCVHNSNCGTEFLISVEDSCLLGVAFENVSLTHDAYMAIGLGKFHIECCSFENCTTDRADERWFCRGDTRRGKV